MTKGLLYSTWHIANRYGASYYIGSAQTPTEYELERAQYERIRDQYSEFENYWDGDDGNLVMFYDVEAQLDAHAAQMDRAERNQQTVDAGYGQL